MKNVVFFGSGYFVIPIVQVLKEQGLKLVVTNEPEGELVKFLKTEEIPYICTKLKNPEDIKKIADLQPDMGILASYGAFIPQQVINLFPLGILNVHPSLLPKYKGPSPIQYTILNGDTVCGISIIQLDDQIDHGPIIKQKEIPLDNPKVDAKTLTELAFSEGAQMLKEIIQDVNYGLPLKSFPQDTKNESWTEKITKEDGRIDMSKIPGKLEIENWKLKIARMIRAYYPWPGVYLTASLNGTERLLKLMPNDIVQVEGKNKMSYKDFINGYKEGKEILLKLQLL